MLSLAILLVLPTASASSTSLSYLKSTVSSFDDPRMDSVDLAFYLVSHDIDATPKGSYVEVDLDGDIYKLTPNGSAPGLCSIEA
ncbi:MAG: hypothetical protein EHM14_14965 [Methanothrix sp.]|nr:MAG: hypothetical protein EHM14_14965 [Methanothrix sp.]